MNYLSLNGNTKLPQGKPLKGGMSQNSEHETFWRSAIIVLNTVCYYNSNKKKFIKIPCIVNLIKTLQAVAAPGIWCWVGDWVLSKVKTK
jgi:hypothetical protein